MKKILFVISMLVISSAFAQPVSRCSSFEYQQLLEARDPSILEKRLLREAETRKWSEAHPESTQGTVITIPVVFHLLYNDTSKFLDDNIIMSQLDVINEDYRRLNADASQTPLAFNSIAADCEINFCLAKRTPNDLPTTGIIHKVTSVTAFGNYDEPKFNVLGGDDAWDASRYLNIWVAAFQNPNFLGLGTFPGGDPQYDGVVINYKACGRIGSHLMAHYNKGRSLTHEIGHWLNLVHIWGDDGGACSSDDFISDTPSQASETFGCPAYPKTDACSSSFPGIMFMNFMDYTDDQCMNLFTQGQKTRMLAALNNDRTSILTSNGCMSVGIEETDLKNFFQAYPNPASGTLYLTSNLVRNINAEIYLLNVVGEKVMSIQSGSESLKPLTSINVSSISAGYYFLRIKTTEGQATVSVILQ